MFHQEPLLLKLEAIVDRITCFMPVSSDLEEGLEAQIGPVQLTTQFLQNKNTDPFLLKFDILTEMDLKMRQISGGKLISTSISPNTPLMLSVLVPIGENKEGGFPEAFIKIAVQKFQLTFTPYTYLLLLRLSNQNFQSYIPKFDEEIICTSSPKSNQMKAHVRICISDFMVSMFELETTQRLSLFDVQMLNLESNILVTSEEDVDAQFVIKQLLVFHPRSSHCLVSMQSLDSPSVDLRVKTSDFAQTVRITMILNAVKTVLSCKSLVDITQWGIAEMITPLLDIGKDFEKASAVIFSELVKDLTKKGMTQFPSPLLSLELQVHQLQAFVPARFERETEALLLGVDGISFNFCQNFVSDTASIDVSFQKIQISEGTFSFISSEISTPTKIFNLDAVSLKENIADYTKHRKSQLGVNLSPLNLQLQLHHPPLFANLYEGWIALKEIKALPGSSQTSTVNLSLRKIELLVGTPENPLAHLQIKKLKLLHSDKTLLSCQKMNLLLPFEGGFFGCLSVSGAKKQPAFSLTVEDSSLNFGIGIIKTNFDRLIVSTLISRSVEWAIQLGTCCYTIKALQTQALQVPNFNVSMRLESFSISFILEGKNLFSCLLKGFTFFQLSSQTRGYVVSIGIPFVFFLQMAKDDLLKP